MLKVYVWTITYPPTTGYFIWFSVRVNACVYVCVSFNESTEYCSAIRSLRIRDRMWHFSHFRMYWWGLKTVRPLPLHRYFLSINHHSSNQPKTLNGSKWHKNPKALNPCQLTKILSKTKEFIFIFSICVSVSRYTTKLCTTWLPSLLKHWNQALPNNIRVTVKNNTAFPGHIVARHQKEVI